MKQKGRIGIPYPQSLEAQILTRSNSTLLPTSLPLCGNQKFLITQYATNAGEKTKAPDFEVPPWQVAKLQLSVKEKGKVPKYGKHTTPCAARPMASKAFHCSPDTVHSKV